jgi:hypothetical protein
MGAFYMLDLYLGAVQRLADGLGTLGCFLTDNHLFHDVSGLRNNWVFGRLRHFDRSRLKISGSCDTIHRMALDRGMLLAQLDGLGHRGLGRARIDTDAACLDFTLTDVKGLAHHGE